MLPGDLLKEAGQGNNALAEKKAAAMLRPMAMLKLSH